MLAMTARVTAQTGRNEDCRVGEVERVSPRVLSIRASHVTASAALPMLHKDPFDRILIAQAVAEGLDFVTSDEPISDYPVGTIW